MSEDLAEVSRAATLASWDALCDAVDEGEDSVMVLRRISFEIEGQGYFDRLDKIYESALELFS